MTPIINPWIFYAIDICNNIKVAGFVLGIVILIISFCSIPLLIEGEIKFSLVKKFAKIIVPIFIVCTVLVPSKDTLIKMLIAQNVTYERVEIASETVQDVYDDIISLVDNSKNEKE